jgi:diaminopimelate epimerase
LSGKIPFTKAHGTGNDFIIFLQDECPEIITSPEFISTICQRRTGIGADGVLVISDCKMVDYKMDYYNSDGSWETFCANGARCAGSLLKQKGIIKNNATFIGGDGNHEIKFDDENIVWIKMSQPNYQTEKVELFGFSGKHVDSGAKHFVCEAKNLTSNIVKEFGPKIRNSEEFQPHGVNVNFFEYISNSEIKVITYEKGIEKVMLSCGSGSVASAYHANNISNLISPVTIQVPGGILNLKFDKTWENVWLGGPAVLLFESQINLNDFLPTIS